MKAKVLSSKENLSQDEWLELRNQGIGGSDSAAACGLSRWKSPMQLWLEKKSLNQPKKPGEAAYWGKQLEPIIREEFKLRTGLEVQPEKKVLQHPDYSFMLANIDGVVIDPEYGEGLFEAKTTGQRYKKEWQKGIPVEYMLQVQHYLAVTGYTFCYVAVLIGGNHFKYKLIFRDEKIICLLVELESRFWESVQSNRPPEVEGLSLEIFLLQKLLKGGKFNGQNKR